MPGVGEELAGSLFGSLGAAVGEVFVLAVLAVFVLAVVIGSVVSWAFDVESATAQIMAAGGMLAIIVLDGWVLPVAIAVVAFAVLEVFEEASA